MKIRKDLDSIFNKTPCSIDGCNTVVTPYAGPGADFCRKHQGNMKEWGGLGTRKRGHTLNKGTVCEVSGYSPYEDPEFLAIEDKEVRDEVMRRALHVDHKKRKADGGDNSEENNQTISYNQHLIKTVKECLNK